jgi:hydroxyacylglutathione hydrolase
MLIKHFFVEKIAHSSYLIAGNHACVVVDPERNIEGYLAAAADLDVRITHIIETHLHADFVSGHMDLADATGADIYAPKLAKCAFPHVAVREGDGFEIEHMRFDVLETPGHTPEHVSYVVTDTVRGSKPACVFSGDTLFVGDVGRPDLFPGRARELADKLYDSLHEKLLKLPDFCEVLPAHGAGSLCGRAMASKWRSTIGYEKRYNSALRIKDRDAFVGSLTENMPAAPDHFGRLSAINAKGPTPVRKLPAPRALLPHEFEERTRARRTTVVDVRSYDAYGGQHLRNSISLPLAGNFPTFAGWVLPHDHHILLVAENRDQVLAATSWLRRVGLDRADAFLEGGASPGRRRDGRLRTSVRSRPMTCTRW